MKTKMTCIVVMIAIAIITSQAFAVDLLNGGFEAPNAGRARDLVGLHDNWDYNADFQSGVIDQNNATFCPDLAAAEGVQFAYLWCPENEVAQTIDGFTIDETYLILWKEAARAITPNGNLWVLMDNETLMAAHDVPNDETWRQQSVEFTATATSHRLRFYHAGAWDTMTFVDEVQITPEPATFGLFALGGFAFLRRK